MKTRILSIFLAICIALPLLPVEAAAAEAPDTDAAISESSTEGERPVPEEEASREPEFPDRNGLEDLPPAEDAPMPEAPAELSGSDTVTYPVEGGNLSFDPETGTVTGCQASVTSAEIPSSIDGVDVTCIGRYAFDHHSNLVKVTIPNSVTNIGYGAFNMCTALADVVIPNSVTSIGDWAFNGCSGLSNVTIPDSIIDIGYAVFRASGLTRLTIPNTITSIGDEAFAYCNNLTEVTIPNSVSNIMDTAFNSSSSISYVKLTGKGDMSEAGLFVWKHSKSNELVIDIEKGITSIRESAFYNHSGLSSVTIPDSVTSIGKNAFYGCSNLADIEIPVSVTSIGDYAYHHCSSLTSITIPNSVNSIGRYTFYGCTGLKKITIPDSVTDIGDWAFANCNGLEDAGPLGGGYSYEFGWTAKIPDNAFYECSNLKSITIPSSIISIGSHSFYNCEGLSNILIPDSVTSIGELAFGSCGGLTSITIPNNISSVGNNLFYGCKSISHVRISGNGDMAEWIPGIWGENKEILSAVEIERGITSIADHAFYSCSRLTDITLPAGLMRIGNSAFYQCQNLVNITIPDSVNSIGTSAFYGCKGLTNLSVPDSVTGIGDHAFTDCSNLTCVAISSSVSNIADYLFSGCSSLENITIPGGVASIGNNAFSGCSGLKWVTLPDSLTNIGNYAFWNCRGLTCVTIPDSVTSIGDSAFNGCNGLTSLTIPDGVTSIGNFTFSGCSQLTSVTIPASITGIGSSAFNNCASLTDVYYAGTKEQWTALKVSGLLPSVTIHYNYGAPVPEGEMLNWDGTDRRYTLAVGEELTLTVSQNSGGALDENRLNCRLDPALGVVEITDRKQNNVTLRGVSPGQATLTVTLAPDISAGEDIASSRPKVSQIITVIDQRGIHFQDAGERYVVGCGKSKDICALAANLSQQDAENVTWSVGDGRGLAIVKSSNINLGSEGAGLGRVYIGLRGIVAGENSLKLTLPDGRTATIPVTVTGARNLDQTNEPPLSSGMIAAEGGDLGNGVSWKLGNGGVLVFSGSGAIPNYNSEAETPWNQFRDKVRTIKIGSGITGIGNNAFKNFSGLQNVVLSAALDRIGIDAFYVSKGSGSLQHAEFDGEWGDWTALMAKTEGGNDPLKNLTRGQITVNIQSNKTPSNNAYEVKKYPKTNEERARSICADLSDSIQKYIKHAKDAFEGHFPADVDPNTQAAINDQKRIEALKKDVDLKNALEKLLAGTTPARKENIKKAIYLRLADMIDRAVKAKFKIGTIDLNKGKFGKIDFSYQLISMQIIENAGSYIQELLTTKIEDEEPIKVTTGTVVDTISIGYHHVKGYTIQIKTDVEGGNDAWDINHEMETELGYKMADIKDTEGMVYQYLNELCGEVQNLTKKVVPSYTKYLDGLTNFSSELQSLGQEGAQRMITDFLHYFDMEDGTNIAVNAYQLGQIGKAVKNIAGKKGVTLNDLQTAAEQIQSAGNLTFREIADKTAINLIQKINESAKDYVDTVITGSGTSVTEDEEEWAKQQVGKFKNSTSRMTVEDWSYNKLSISGPLDLNIYDSSGACVGTVAGGSAAYGDALMLTAEIDHTNVYLPGGMDVRFEFTGTGQGEMTYVMEEVRNGETVGRRNYYGIPLADGVSYTQSFHTGDALQDLQSDALTAADGSTIGGSEYLDAWDGTQNSAIYIDCVAEGGGMVTGAGNFVKGDAVTLCAAPDDGYEFTGWYIGGRLVSAENPYQFAALVSAEVHARFRVPYQESERFDASASSRYNAVAAVYEDGDGLSHIGLYQLSPQDSEGFTTVQVKLYRADHTLCSTETLTADFDMKSSYWLPAMDLRDYAKVELYDPSGNIIAALASPEWNDEIKAVLRYRQLQILDTGASLAVSISSPDGAGVTGKLIAAAYSGGRQLACTVIPDVTAGAGAGTERQVSVDWRKKESNVEIKLFFVNDSCAPLAAAVTAK